MYGQEVWSGYIRALKIWMKGPYYAQAYVCCLSGTQWTRILKGPSVVNKVMNNSSVTSIAQRQPQRRGGKRPSTDFWEAWRCLWCCWRQTTWECACNPMINFISRQENLLPAINSIMRNCAPVSFLYYIYCELCDDEGCFVKTLVSSLQYLESNLRRKSHH